jgi:hypothetical protein
MSLVHRCDAPGCETLTMGRFCVAHEPSIPARSRAQRIRRRVQTPILAVVLALLGVVAGRLSGRAG